MENYALKSVTTENIKDASKKALARASELGIKIGNQQMLEILASTLDAPSYNHLHPTVSGHVFFNGVDINALASRLIGALGSLTVVFEANEISDYPMGDADSVYLTFETEQSIVDFYREVFFKQSVASYSDFGLNGDFRWSSSCLDFDGDEDPTFWLNFESKHCNDSVESPLVKLSTFTELLVQVTERAELGVENFSGFKGEFFATNEYKDFCSDTSEPIVYFLAGLSEREAIELMNSH